MKKKHLLDSPLQPDAFNADNTSFGSSATDILLSPRPGDPEGEFLLGLPLVLDSMLTSLSRYELPSLALGDAGSLHPCGEREGGCMPPVPVQVSVVSM